MGNAVARFVEIWNIISCNFKLNEDMKHKSLKLAIVAVVTAIAGYGVYQNQIKSTAMSDIAKANVEALARSEIGEKCGGCSTEYSKYCCTLVIEGLGTYILGRP